MNAWNPNYYSDFLSVGFRLVYLAFNRILRYLNEAETIENFIIYSIIFLSLSICIIRFSRSPRDFIELKGRLWSTFGQLRGAQQQFTTFFKVKFAVRIEIQEKKLEHIYTFLLLLTIQNIQISHLAISWHNCCTKLVSSETASFTFPPKNTISTKQKSQFNF